MDLSDRNSRAAALACVLARAVRDGEVAYPDARRAVVHELRRLNNNRKLEIRPRSVAAEASIAKYGAAGVPKNGSPDALHADHYASITLETFERVATQDEWLRELDRIASSVVCVTARENYELEQYERRGIVGPDKYAAAGVQFVDPVPWDAHATRGEPSG
jgi:hypothetical protein